MDVLFTMCIPLRRSSILQLLGNSYHNKHVAQTTEPYPLYDHMQELLMGTGNLKHYNFVLLALSRLHIQGDVWGCFHLLISLQHRPQTLNSRMYSVPCPPNQPTPPPFHSRDFAFACTEVHIHTSPRLVEYPWNLEQLQPILVYFPLVTTPGHTYTRQPTKNDNQFA